MYMQSNNNIKSVIMWINIEKSLVHSRSIPDIISSRGMLPKLTLFLSQ